MAKIEVTIGHCYISRCGFFWDVEANKMMTENAILAVIDGQQSSEDRLNDIWKQNNCTLKSAKLAWSGCFDL